MIDVAKVIEMIQTYGNHRMLEEAFSESLEGLSKTHGEKAEKKIESIEVYLRSINEMNKSPAELNTMDCKGGQ